MTAAARGIAVLAAIGVLSSGCARLRAPDLRAGEASLDTIHVAAFGSADPSNRQATGLARSAYSARWFFLSGLSPGRPLPRPARIDPILLQSAGGMGGAAPVTVIVSFRDTVHVPRFPRLLPGRPRTDPANRARIDSAGVIIRSLIARRSAEYQADTTGFAAAFHARVLSNFWVVQACRVELPHDSAASLLARSGIVYVGPDTGRVAPQGGAGDGTANDVAAARAQIGTDAYFDLPLDPGSIALIDTGVRSTHRFLSGPSHLCLVSDCISGAGDDLDDAACGPESGVPGDSYVEGHGTSSAGILTGNGNDLATGAHDGSRFRGVTRASLDCFQVYGQDRRVRIDAVLHALERAMARLDPVIVLEMEDNEQPGVADVSQAADNAYSAGFVILAANGNDVHLGVGAPAIARRTLGIGAYDVQHGYMTWMAHGPSDDGRTKPDLLAPSQALTASNAGDLGTQYHTGTSGSTPFAAGAASLLFNWMSVGAAGPDPGQVYSMLLLSGDETGPFANNSEHGAGRIRIPAAGTARYGKVWLSPATRFVDVPIEMRASEHVQALKAALWWPETTIVRNGAAVDTHNDVDLELVSPGWFGRVRARSESPDGVFESIAVAGTPTLHGRWRVRVRARTMRTGYQVVYWSAALTP